MTKQEFSKWYDNIDLAKYVFAQAKRHANNEADVADFMQEAWERVCQLPCHATLPRIQREVYNAIATAYQRQLRHRKHEIPFSRMN